MTALVLAASLSGMGMLTAYAQEADAPPLQNWSFAGPFGQYDPEQLQRGFKIYREVCSNCHSLKLLAFRNLADPGGPGFTEAQAAAIAATFQVTDGPNDQGQMFQRPGKISDHFPPPFANDQAARAALGGSAAAGHVRARQGAQLRARLSLVHLRRFHRIPGGRPGLHSRHPQRLYRRACRIHAAAGRAVQQVFSRPRHRHAQAARATAKSNIPTARRPRSTNTAATSPPS